MTYKFNFSEKPFIIAEIGGNHEGNFEYARKLTKLAVESGVDAVKFQSYAAESFVSEVVDPASFSKYNKFALSTEEYIELAKMVRGEGVQFMTSIWGHEFLEALDPYIEVHKVGSGDLTNYPLIKAIIKKNKPTCIAVGMSTLQDVKDVIAFIGSVDPNFIPGRKLSVMHCVAMYGDPQDEYANLNGIATLREELSDDIIIGYSDHTKGNVAVKVALELGAQIIETHFSDDITRSFRDNHFAHTKESLREFIEYCRRRTKMFGHGRREPISEVETEHRRFQFRRACFFKKDMKKGEVATEDNLTTLRPQEGIPSENYYKLIGRKLTRDIKKSEPLSWKDFEGQY